MIQGFYYLGTLTRLFGLKGELCALFDTDNPDHYLNLATVFVETGGDCVPFPIEKLRYRGGNQFVIKFKNLDCNMAQSLLHCDLYLPMSELPKLTGNSFYFHEVVGFRIIDEKKGDIGICSDFIELTENPVMCVKNGDKEILIPANQHFIQKIDRNSKILYINAPENLIDLYMS